MKAVLIASYRQELLYGVKPILKQPAGLAEGQYCRRITPLAKKRPCVILHEQA